MPKKDLKTRATSGRWKGGKRKEYTYEGTQYTGGRVAGRKNLVKTEAGTLLNQHGIEFTLDERKALERAVNRSNRIRKKMIEEEAKLPRLQGGKDTGDTVRSLQLMGKESDFIISRQSKSLQRFKSRKDYDDFMQKQERIASGEHLSEATKLYKRNHMKALENVFGDEAKDVVMKIRMMKPEKYRQLLQSDEDLEVSFVYDPAEAQARLNRIRQALGMKAKEDYIEE